MTQNSKKAMRKRLLINNKLQGKFIFVVTVIVLLVILIQVSSIWILAKKDMTQHSIVSKLRTTRDVRQLIIDKLIYITIITVLVGVGAATYLMLYFTHKIAGPMYRFSKTFEKIRKLDLTQRIKFRDGDELQDMADSFSLAIEALHKNMRSLRAATDELNTITAKRGAKPAQIKKAALLVIKLAKKFKV